MMIIIILNKAKLILFILAFKKIHWYPREIIAIPALCVVVLDFHAT